MIKNVSPQCMRNLCKSEQCHPRQTAAKGNEGAHRAASKQTLIGKKELSAYSWSNTENHKTKQKQPCDFYRAQNIVALLTDALKNEQEYFMQHGTDDDDGWVMAGWMKEGWMDGMADGQMEGGLGGRMKEGWMDGRMDGLVDEWMDGWRQVEWMGGW